MATFRTRRQHLKLLLVPMNHTLPVVCVLLFILGDSVACTDDEVHFVLWLNYSPLLILISMQLPIHHIAARHGLDIDQQRNLAKSVAVE